MTKLHDLTVLVIFFRIGTQPFGTQGKDFVVLCFKVHILNQIYVKNLFIIMTEY
jgi:hypothetical protein